MADLKFTANTSEASKKIDSLQKQIDKLETDIAKNKKIDFDTRVAEAKIKGLKNAISSILKDVAKETQQQALGTKDLFHTDENIKKLKSLSNQITALYKDIANNGGTKTQIAELNKLNASFNGTLSAIKRVGTEQQKQEADAIRNHKNTINRITDEKNAIEQVAKADSQRMSAANKSMTEYQKLINEYISLLKKAENAKNNTTSKNALKPSEEQYMYGYPDGTAGRFDQIQARLKEIRDTYGDIPVIQAQIAQMDDHMANQIGYQQRLAREKSEFQQIIDLQKQAYNVEQKMQQLVSAPKKNKNMINELKQEHQELMKQYDAWKSVTNITETESKLLKEQAQNFQRISNQAQAHAKDMSSLNKSYDKFSATVGNIFKYIITYQLYNRMVEGVQNAIQIMKDLDAAFTDIQMVTMGTEEETYQLSLQYNDLAKEMGATTQEIAEGATEWLRQGKTAEETTELLRASMTLSKVGAIESSQATELLTSSLNGYKIAAQDAMSVVDKISSIDLAAATSSEELAVALSRTANSAADAEVSLDKLLGMIGTVSSVTRKSASTIGESFKTIFARMSNVAAGKDTDDEGESLNDVEKTLNSLGITLRKSQYEWRSFEDVLDEVAEKWDVFSDTEQSKIATAIAGVRQQENFRALMNNWDSVKELTAVAENSMGSASEKMEIYLDSVEAKTKEVQAAWEEFILKLNQSDSYKMALDFVIFLIENLPLVAQAILSALAAWKGWSTVSKIMNEIETTTQLTTIATQTQVMADELAKKSKDNYTTSVNNNSLALGKNTKEIQTNSNALKGSQTQVGGVSKALGSFKTVLGGISIAFSVFTTVLSIASSAIAAYEAKMANLKDKVEDAAQKVDAIQDDINNLDGVLETLATTEEQYKNNIIDINEKNASLQSVEEQLVSIYGEKAEAINLVNKSYSEQAEIIGELRKQELYEQKAEIQKVKSEKEELLNRNVNTVMGSEENYYGLDSSVQRQIQDIVSRNNMTLTERTFADQISITGKASDQVKVYKELQQLQKDLLAQGKEADAQRVASMLNAEDFGGVFGLGKNIGMQKEYEKSGGDSLDVLDDEQLINFQIANDKLLSEHRGYLQKRNGLIEEFNAKKDEIDELEKQKEEAKTQKEKKQLDNQIKTAETQKNKYYDAIIASQDQVDKTYQSLLTAAGTNEELKKYIEDTFAEFDENPFFQTAPEHIDSLKDSFSDFYDEIKNLDTEFEKGNISAKQYFDGLNSYISKLDLSNKNQDLETLKNNLSGLFGNNASYLDSFIGTLFEDNIADAEDVANLQAYTSNLSQLIETLKTANAEGGVFEGLIDDTLFSGDGKTDEQRQKEISDLKQQIEDKQQEILKLQGERASLDTKEYDVSYRTTKGNKQTGKYTQSAGVYDAKNYKGEDLPQSASYAYSEMKSDGAEQYESDLKDIENKIEDAEKAQENLNEQIQNLESGEGLDNYKSELSELGEVLEDMEIDKTQEAFDTLAEGLDSGAISDSISSIEQLPDKYRSAFLEVADDIVTALGSSNEAVRTQAEQSLEALIGTEAEMMLSTVDFANLTTEQMAQVATDIANKAIIAQGGVTSSLQAFAAENNKIASTAMGQAVQTLGLMLGDIGEALSQIDVQVPVKIPKIQMHLGDFLTGGDLFQMPRTRRK